MHLNVIQDHESFVHANKTYWQEDSEFLLRNSTFRLIYILTKKTSFLNEIKCFFYLHFPYFLQRNQHHVARGENRRLRYFAEASQQKRPLAGGWQWLLCVITFRL